MYSNSEEWKSANKTIFSHPRCETTHGVKLRCCSRNGSKIGKKLIVKRITAGILLMRQKPNFRATTTLRPYLA